MQHAKANAAASEYLRTLKPGAGITFSVNGAETAAKFTSYHSGAHKFLCSVGKGRTPTWVELNHLVVPDVALVPSAPVPAPVAAPERVHVGELGQRVLAALGANGGPMLANDVAAAIEENIRKAAGSFPALVKAGLIESQGGENKKGGKMISLTRAGLVYVGIEDAEPASTAPEPVAPLLECTEAHVLAMEAVGEEGMDVTDIFVANLLTDLAEHHPWPVAKFPPRNNPDAYFFAALTGEGGEYVVFMRETLRMGPKPVPAVVAGKLGGKRNAAIMAEGTRIQRSESQRLRTSKKAVVEDGLPTRTTGRAGAARQSLREVVLSALANYDANNKLSVGYKLTIKDLQVELSLTALQVQNAMFKLTKAGFLATDEQGRTANPVALTERGKTGYSTNHDGQPLRPLIEAAIAEGLDDKAVALRVRCDVAYVHDVRTNRRIKPKAEAVEA